jgi:hypothetical protein
MEHRRRADPSNDIARALSLKAAAAKVSQCAAAGMSASASAGEAVAVSKGEDKTALLQRLRQQVDTVQFLGAHCLSLSLAAGARGARETARAAGANPAAEARSQIVIYLLPFR